MSKTWIAIIAGSAGIGVGLLIAKLYAQQTATSTINSTLSSVGVTSPTVQKIADNLLVPSFS